MAIRRNAPDAPQMDLLGGAPTELHRLFFALFPSDDVREQCRRVAADVEAERPLRGRRNDPSRYHATLNFLGDHAGLRQDMVEGALAAAATVTPEPFAWTLDYVTGFQGGNPPCVLRGRETPAALEQLWRDLKDALARKGIRTLGSQFTPHVTLGYDHGTAREPIAIAPIEWHVDGFALVHSIVGRHEYRILGNWAYGSRR
ncbi:MAG TPA: RNA 2',3'-cyclic phosphodiesterase [Luteibacter sp.]|nr:RNA 2',3'-cyclic phosphodiesterase [Luteibacter sp.]